jgi:hypothetical protein
LYDSTSLIRRSMLCSNSFVRTSAFILLSLNSSMLFVHWNADLADDANLR